MHPWTSFDDRVVSEEDDERKMKGLTPCTYHFIFDLIVCFLGIYVQVHFPLIYFKKGEKKDA